MSLYVMLKNRLESLSQPICTIQTEIEDFPYELQTSTPISDQKKHDRVQFAQYCLLVLGNDADYLRKPVFSSECVLSLSGGMNMQKCRIWRAKRPQEVLDISHSAG